MVDQPRFKSVIMSIRIPEMIQDTVSIYDLGEVMLLAALVSMVDHEQRCDYGYQLLGNGNRYCLNN